MPKRSKEQTEVTIQIIKDAVTDQLIRFGYDKMSYTSLSEQTGVSRTGISHHFPKKTDFIVALDNRMFEKFVDHLDTDNDLTSFSKSWLKAIDNNEFLAIFRILFHHIVNAESAEVFTRNNVKHLYSLLEGKYGEQGSRELEWLLGRTISVMSMVK